MATIMEPTKRDVIFVLGAPGAGKGTLCKQLAHDYGLRHLSVGDLLRRVTSTPHSGSGQDADDSARGYVRRGELLPTELLFPILEPELLGDGCLSGHTGNNRPVLLLDGFPRELEQCRQFELVFGHPVLVLFFDCPRELAEQRVVTRKAGRPGDNLEMFEKRYREFLELNPPILAHFREQGTLITIDTSRETSRSWEKLLGGLKASPAWNVLMANGGIS